MNEVYLGAYRRGDANLPEPVFPERLHGQTVIAELEGSDAAGRVGAGFGWQRYPQLAAVNESLLQERLDLLHPRARFLLPLGANSLQVGIFIDPKDIMPAYLRNKVAEEPS